MSKRSAVVLLVVALVGLGGWAGAQPGAPAPKKSEAEAGRYAVSAGGGKAILLDTTTGKTWQLRESADGHNAVWLPLSRIEDAQEAAKWQAEQEDLRRQSGQRGGGDARGAAAEGEGEDYQIFRLKHAQASDLAKALQQLLAGRDGAAVRLVADERTNSLVLRGSAKQVEVVRNLVRELDVPGAGGQGEQKKP